MTMDLSKLPPPAVLLKSAQAQAQCAKLIKSESIELNRGLQSNVPPLGYVNLLGTDFLRTLMSIDESTWLDGGCGHLRAQVDGATRYRTWLPRLPSMVAVTTILDEATISAAAFLGVVYEQLKSATFSLIRGSVELLDDGKVTDVALISDVMGDFAYSQHPDQVLARYASMLRRGGQAFVYRPCSCNMHVSDGNDQQWSFEELEAWLLSFSGVRTTFTECAFGGRIIHMERLDDPVVVPPLEPLLYIPGNPPIRIFRPATATARA